MYMYIYICKYVSIYIYIYAHINRSIDCEKQHANGKALSCITHGGALNVYNYNYQDFRCSLLFPFTEEIRDGQNAA